MEILREAFSIWLNEGFNSHQPVRKWNNVKESGREISLSWPQMTEEFLILKNKLKNW